MSNKYKIIIILLILPLLFGFLKSRFGPWWGLTARIGAPSAPSAGLKIYADANNNFASIDANSIVTEYGAGGGGSGDITDVWDCSSGDCSTPTVGNGESLTFGSGAVLSMPNANADVTADAAGEIFYDESDDQFVFYDSQTGELSANEVALSPILHKEKVLDPGSWYNSDTEIFIMTVGDNAPNGIIIDEWKCSCNVDPDTEIDADLRYADAWIGLANAADIDEIDTTNGVSSEDTDSNINGGSAVSNGKVIYIGFDADPEGTCTQMIFEMWYHAID